MDSHSCVKELSRVYPDSQIREVIRGIGEVDCLGSMHGGRSRQVAPVEVWEGQPELRFCDTEHPLSVRCPSALTTFVSSVVVEKRDEAAGPFRAVERRKLRGRSLVS